MRMGGRTVILLAERYDAHENHKLVTPIIQELEFVIAGENTSLNCRCVPKPGIEVIGGYGIS